MTIKMYLWFWLIVTAVACKQDGVYNPGPPPNYGPSYWGEVVGQRNSITLVNSRINGSLRYYNPPDSCTKKTFGLLIDEFDNSGCVRLTLSLHAIPRQVGAYTSFQYKLIGDQCSAALLPHIVLYYVECDAYLGDYILDSKATSQLVIKSIDLNTGEVSGMCDLKLVVNRRPYPTSPDEVHIIATFKTKLLPEGQLKYQ